MSYLNETMEERAWRAYKSVVSGGKSRGAGEEAAGLAAAAWVYNDKGIPIVKLGAPEEDKDARAAYDNMKVVARGWTEAKRSVNGGRRSRKSKRSRRRRHTRRHH